MVRLDPECYSRATAEVDDDTWPHAYVVMHHNSPCRRVIHNTGVVSVAKFFGQESALGSYTKIGQAACTRRAL